MFNSVVLLILLYPVKNIPMVSNIQIIEATYDYETLKPKVYEILQTHGLDRIKAGNTVLIKPNLLLAAPSQMAVTTHPLVVKSACEFALSMGARVQISDSPAMGAFRKIIKQGGYEEALTGLDVKIAPFEDSEKINIGNPFGSIEVARDAVHADYIINLAKLKTHAQMLLTLGVKNMFGCIIGLRKARWHLRAGIDRRMFARLLVRLYESLRPDVTIVDGILALEGLGPGKGGKARELGWLVSGVNAHSVDKTICTLLGMRPADLATLEQAQLLGVFDGEAHVTGHMRIINDFELPELGPLTFGSDRFLRLSRRHLIQRPVPNNRRCKLCGECWKICPAKVIAYNDRGIRIDYLNCIRCYCCVEVCPHGAILAKEPVLGQIIRKISS
jgi:uncharacterized protein (DUF362 family)/Pyruvate/2-oxoacid:ferredoxin oxidoreductase delta subunit